MSNTTRRKVRWDGERMRAYVIRDAVRYWSPQETVFSRGVDVSVINPREPRQRSAATGCAKRGRRTQLLRAMADNPHVPAVREDVMGREFGLNTPHTKAECLANADRTQKRADSYRARGWAHTANEWDKIADGWRKKSETAPEAATPPPPVR